MPHGIYNGMAVEDCATECQECGREFSGPGTWDVEFHEGYGTRSELHPDDDSCPGCRGEGDCEGTFAHDAAGLFQRIRCSSTKARTRICIEPSGSKTVLGIYCDECNAFYEDEE